MRIMSREELVACGRGANQVRQEEKGLQFLRHPDAAIDYYGEYGPYQRDWAQHPSGVALEFYTDSDQLHLEIVLSPAADAPAFFDIWIDDQFAGSVGGAAVTEELAQSFWLSVDGERQERLVTLYLWHSRQCWIRSIGLDDDASMRPGPERPVLLVLGDSIARGGNADHPSLTYATLAARKLGMSLHNCGVGGHVFDAASLPERPIENPALIYVAYGINDWGRNRDIGEARAYLERLRDLYPTTTIVVQQPIYRKGADDQPAQPNEQGQLLSTYREALATLVAQMPKMLCLPWQELFPRDASMLVDSTHPNTAGHIVYGGNVACLLRGIIEGKQ